jgi:spermidine synthase
VIDSLAFYRRCRSVLATSGVLVVNLFGEHDSYLRSTERIGEAFGGRLLALPPVPAGNVVLLAFKGPPMQVDWQVLRRRARELDRVGLPARAWFEALRGQQGRFARSRP